MDIITKKKSFYEGYEKAVFDAMDMLAEIIKEDDDKQNRSKTLEANDEILKK